MTEVRKYRNSLLALLCIVSWGVIVFRVCLSSSQGAAVPGLLFAVMISIGVAIVGGIVLLFVDILRKGKVRGLFVYSLFATMNIVIGSLGMILTNKENGPTPYLVASSLSIGVLMIVNVYSRAGCR